MVLVCGRHIYDNSFFYYSVRGFVRLGLRMGCSELELLGQFASFERRLRGATQTPLAVPYPFRTWPVPGRRGLSETSEKYAIFCILGGIRPNYSWILACAELELKKHTGTHYPKVTIIYKLASYFVPTTLFTWSHLIAFALLSYDCCVVAFRYHYTQCPCLFCILERCNITWSQINTVVQSEPNSRD